MKPRRQLILGDFRDLEQRLPSVVQEMKGDAPLAAILVLVPSHLLGLHLSRWLTEQQHARINLRFATFGAIQREVGEFSLLAPGKLRLPDLADLVIVRKTCLNAGDNFYFKPVFDRPGLHTALLATISDLRMAGITVQDLRKHMNCDDECPLSDGRGSGAAVKYPLSDGRGSGAAVKYPLSDGRGSESPGNVSKLDSLLSVWQEYERALEEYHWADSAAVLQAVADGFADYATSISLRGAIVYGFYDFTEMQRRVVKAICEQVNTVVMFPFTGEESSAYSKPMRRWLVGEGFIENGRMGERESGSHGQADSPIPPFPHSPTQGVSILSVPSEPEEAREVVREIVKAVRGDAPLKLHEIGVLVRNADTYGSLLKESLENVGITGYIYPTEPIARTPEGKSFLLMLDVLESDFARRPVMDFLIQANLAQECRVSSVESPTRHSPDFAEAPSGNRFGDGACREGQDTVLVPPSATELPVMSWNRLTAELGILKGRGEWERRIDRFIEKRSREQSRDEEDEPVRDDRVDSAKSLLAFIRGFCDRISEVENAADWPQLVGKALDAFIAVTRETDGQAAVVKAIRKLEDLSLLASGRDIALFRYLCGKALSAPAEPDAEFQREGPAVVELMTARGVPFRYVIVPGMVEKGFPALLGQDPILLDEERRAVNLAVSGQEDEPLPIRGRNIEEEHLLYRLAVGAATEKLLLTYPRFDESKTRKRVPSHFLLDTVKALTGTDTSFEELKSFGGLRPCLLSQLAPPLEECITVAEYDLSQALAIPGDPENWRTCYLPAISAHFKRSLEAEHQRWDERRFTAYDGILGSPDALEELRKALKLPEGPFSPTRLQRFARCPYSFFLDEVIGIEVVDDPEDQDGPPVANWGNVIHKVLAQFYERVIKSRQLGRLVAEDRGRLREVAERLFRAYEQDDLTGSPLVWQVHRDRWLRNLDLFFDHELAEEGFFPGAVEWRFDEGHSREFPVSLESGATVRFRGRVDRIDFSSDGSRARVVDYKTGKLKGSKEIKGFDAGRELQLAVYLLAVKELMRGCPGLENAEYYHIGPGEGFGKRYMEWRTVEQNQAELCRILSVILDVLSNGRFIVTPDTENCKFCSYSLVCGAGKEVLFMMKQGDPGVSDFLGLRHGK